jgi:hypothetical protein
MAEDNKKKMKAELSVSPFAEMDKKTEAWVKSIPALEKVFKPIQHVEAVELDKRKWSASKLKEALAGLARYDLKILAQRAATHQKAHQKQGPKALQAAEKQLPVDYKAISKELIKKASLAIEEVANDKGNNKRALKDGKAALKKAVGLDEKSIFAEPADLAGQAMAHLANKLEELLEQEGTTGKEAAKARGQAAKEMAEADKLFEASAREAEAAVEMLRGLRKTIKDDAAPELCAFREKVKKADAKLKPFQQALARFGKEMDAALAAAKDGKADVAAVRKLANELVKTSKESAAAKAAMAEMKSLKTEFDKVEQKLK